MAPSNTRVSVEAVKRLLIENTHHESTVRQIFDRFLIFRVALIFNLKIVGDQVLVGNVAAKM